MNASTKLIDSVFKRLGSASSSSSKHPKLSTSPFITIARDPGSGGKPIAHEVAKNLGFEFYDRALIEAIAKSAKRRHQVVDNVDERTRSAIQDLVHNLFNPEYISDTTYLNHLTRVVLSLASQGKVVILGRGANFIIPRQESLNVLITAPKSVRISRAIEYEHINQKEAKKRIEKISKERRDFVSQYFNKRYANPNYYDLIVNTQYLNLDQATELVISSFRAKFPSFLLL